MTDVPDTTATTAEPEDSPFTYGDDPQLDALTDGCTPGDLAACDVLYDDSQLDSDYERYGEACGARTAVLFFGGECSVAFVEGSTDVVNACADGDMAACDSLYQDSAFWSAYEAYGAIVRRPQHPAARRHLPVRVRELMPRP